MSWHAIFLSIVCAVLVDQVRSAHVLNWMANQPPLKPVNQMSQPERLQHPNNLQNRQPDTFADALNFFGQNFEQAPLQNPEKAPEKTPEKTPEETVEQNGQPNASVEDEQLLLVEKSEQDTFNDSRLLSEIGLLAVNKQRCRSNDDCVSYFKEQHCGK